MEKLITSVVNHQATRVGLGMVYKTKKEIMTKRTRRRLRQRILYGVTDVTIYDVKKVNSQLRRGKVIYVESVSYVIDR